MKCFFLNPFLSYSCEFMGGSPVFEPPYLYSYALLVATVTEGSSFFSYSCAPFVTDAPECKFRPFIINRLRTLLRSFALFCQRVFANSFGISSFRTLCKKTGVWGYPSSLPDSVEPDITV